ncbi:hypothetical protein SKAU_G00410060 [Synaphobranchus kaupii]|uniref:Uncharacterized protein n=1 Tax=Synaphobranchus kaupii TaxID=118154 RepID=A0A9Q1E7K9_SYNKA|nr:hypothetical protein SKAU_G00410060 [Synaphobranchus kaupii]
MAPFARRILLGGAHLGPGNTRHEYLIMPVRAKQFAIKKIRRLRLTYQTVWSRRSVCITFGVPDYQLRQTLQCRLVLCPWASVGGTKEGKCLPVSRSGVLTQGRPPVERQGKGCSWISSFTSFSQKSLYGMRSSMGE